MMAYDPYLDQVATRRAVEWIANNGRVDVVHARTAAHDIAKSVHELCECKDAPLFYRITKNGVTQYFKRCQICGKSSTNLPYKLLTDAQKASAIEYNEELHGHYAALYNINFLCDVVKQQFIDAGIALEYGFYIGSDAWRDVRKRVIRLDGGKCQKCGSTSGLECHHIHYMNLGNETEGDLVMLCHECHVKITEEARYIRGPLADSFEVVKTAHHYKNACRKHQHYESLKAKLQAIGLMPNDYERRIRELTDAMEI